MGRSSSINCRHSRTSAISIIRKPRIGQSAYQRLGAGLSSRSKIRTAYVHQTPIESPSRIADQPVRCPSESIIPKIIPNVSPTKPHWVALRLILSRVANAGKRFFTMPTSLALI